MDAEQSLLAEIYEKHKGILYKTALESIGPGVEKDAVVHDALLRLAEHGPTLRRLDENALAVYVAATVRSVALDTQRKLALERRHILDADITELEDLGGAPDHGEEYVEREARRERLRYLREALGELGETDRRLLVGLYLAGESVEDLARELGVKPASVRMKLTRARRRVRKLIEGKEAQG